MSDAGAAWYVRILVLVGIFFPLALMLSLIVDGATGDATDDFIAFSVVGSFFLAIGAAAGMATMRGEPAGAMALGASYAVLLITSFAVFVTDMANRHRKTSATVDVMVWFGAMVFCTGAMRAAYQRYQALSGQTTNYTHSVSAGQGDDGLDHGRNDTMVSVEDEYYGPVVGSSSSGV